jgi:hypothetical protein
LTKDDALETLLKRVGIADFIKTKKDDLEKTIFGLIDSIQQFYPELPITMSILAPLIWDVIKWDNGIRNPFITEDKFDISELDKYGGPFSVKIVEDVMKELQIDMGVIILKKKTK